MTGIRSSVRPMTNLSRTGDVEIGKRSYARTSDAALILTFKYALLESKTPGVLIPQKISSTRRLSPPCGPASNFAGEVASPVLVHPQLWVRVRPGWHPHRRPLPCRDQ